MIEIFNKTLRSPGEAAYLHSTTSDTGEQLNLARVGVGNSLWVGNDGILYLSRTVGGEQLLEPTHLISTEFDKLSRSDFDQTVFVPVPGEPNTVTPVNAYRLGRRNLAVGSNGMLYDVSKEGFVSDISFPVLIGEPRSSSTSVNAKLSKDLEHRAYVSAKAMTP